MKRITLKKMTLAISAGAIMMLAFQNCSKPVGLTGMDSTSSLDLTDSEKSLLNSAPDDLDSEQLKQEIASENIDSKAVGSLSLSSMKLKSVTGDEIVLNLQAAQENGKLPTWLNISKKGVSIGKICMDMWTSKLVAKVASYLAKAQLCEKENSEFNLCKEALNNSELSVTQSSGEVINLSDRSSTLCAKSVDFCDAKHRLFTLMAVRYIKNLDLAIQEDRVPASLRCSNEGGEGN